VIDLGMTQVIDGDLVKVLSWYDNEWGLCPSDGPAGGPHDPRVTEENFEARVYPKHDSSMILRWRLPRNAPRGGELMGALQLEGPILRQRRQRARKVLRALAKLVPKAEPAHRFSDPWELLVAVMLSARCTDQKVNEVTEDLFWKYRTLDDYVRADPDEFERAIKPTGYYREKARRILNAARFVQTTFRGQVPRTMEALLRIPGVGRKSASIVLGAGYGIAEGIAVDMHVRRLSRVLDLTDETDPDKIERDLMKLIPRREWLGFSPRLSEQGRRYYPARDHDHSACPLTRVLAERGGVKGCRRARAGPPTRLDRGA
jgi:endonuclease-3